MTHAGAAGGRGVTAPFVPPHDVLEARLPEGKPAYTPAEARAEAERCLYCHDAPCIQHCPTEIDIPTFIKKIASGNTLGAARTILAQNILGASCARVCPVEVLCVGACVYTDWHRAPIQIGRLQRFATETARADEARGGARVVPPVPRRSDARRVALVGAGPASLACGAYLALEGHHPVLMERGSLVGGLNTTGVAPYKLHTPDALDEAAWVASLGLEVRTGVDVGVDVTPETLLSDYDAVFLGLGLGEDTTLREPGVQGPGVVGATALIARIKNEPGFSLGTVRRAVVVGGGNTAIDAARELRLLGVPDVTMVYRKTAARMPGYRHEMAAARTEGVTMQERSLPTRVLRDATGTVTGIAVCSTEPDAVVADTEREIACDLVVLAIGQSKLRSLAAGFQGVALDARGCVVVDGITRRTGHPRVWAGGDCVNGGKEVVNAVADGREAARAMIAAWRTEARNG